MLHFGEFYAAKIVQNVYRRRQILGCSSIDQISTNVPSKLRGCAAAQLAESPAQYFRSAAHCISIDNRTTSYVLLIFRADLFWELTWPSIPRILSKLLEGTLVRYLLAISNFKRVTFSQEFLRESTTLCHICHSKSNQPAISKNKHFSGIPTIFLSTTLRSRLGRKDGG